jgi:hypothetical protein
MSSRHGMSLTSGSRHPGKGGFKRWLGRGHREAWNPPPWRRFAEFENSQEPRKLKTETLTNETLQGALDGQL